MSPCTIETIVDIAEDRKLIVPLPAGIPPGRYRAVIMLDDATQDVLSNASVSEWGVPIIHDSHWPPDMPLTREEMYDDSH